MRNSAHHSIHRALFFLLVFLLSAGCDTMARHFDVVRGVQAEGNTFYLLVTDQCSFGLGCERDPTPRYYASTDEGETWQQVGSADIGVALSDINSGPPVSKTVCLPSQPFICYRIQRKPEILMSLDRGQTWISTWRFPPSRDAFSIRYMQSVMFRYGASPDTTPYDLAAVSEGAAYAVVVAMGNQGVLVRGPTREWIARSVGSASAVPLRAANVAEARAVLPNEIRCSAVLSLLFAMFLSIRSILSAVRARRRQWMGFLPIVLAGLVFVSLCYMTTVPSFEPLLSPGSTLIAFAPVLAFLVAHIAVMGPFLEWPRLLAHAFLLILMPGALFVALILPFAIWAFTIGPIQLATAAALLLGSCTILLGSRALSGVTNQNNGAPSAA